jgi:hypothetical protein
LFTWVWVNREILPLSTWALTAPASKKAVMKAKNEELKNFVFMEKKI